MPTFQLFRNGNKVDEVVGADIQSVERKIQQHLTSADSTGGGISGKGYVLGSGRAVNASGSSTGTDLNGVQEWLMNNWVVVVAVLGLLYYGLGRQ
jgi:hypothetical protein